jgi:hypothetical protein
MITPAESRAVGCYRVVDPWVGVGTDQFALLARHGRGAGPESRARLIRPRGGHASAHWRAIAGDTLELVWTSAPSDSTRFEPGVVYWDALTARVTLEGDTLRGSTVSASDLKTRDGPPGPPRDVRAIRVKCPDGTPR